MEAAGSAISAGAEGGVALDGWLLIIDLAAHLGLQRLVLTQVSVAELLLNFLCRLEVLSALGALGRALEGSHVSAAHLIQEGRPFLQIWHGLAQTSMFAVFVDLLILSGEVHGVSRHVLPVQVDGALSGVPRSTLIGLVQQRLVGGGRELVRFDTAAAMVILHALIDVVHFKQGG